MISLPRSVVLFLLTLFFLILIPNHPASAQAQFPFGWRITRFNLHASHVLADPTRDRVYVTVPDHRTVEVIDTARLKIIASINVGLEPREMAISSDATHLFVSTQNESFTDGNIAVIDLPTLRIFPLRFTLPYAPGALAVGPDLRLYALAAYPHAAFHQIDANTGALRTVNVPKYAPGGALQISPDLRTLYVNDELISAYDVSTTTPALLRRSSRGVSPAADMQISHDGRALAIPAHLSASGEPTVLFSTASLDDYFGAFDDGGFYPFPFTFSADDTLFYAFQEDGPYLEAFDTRTFTLAARVALPAKVQPALGAKSLAVDRTGSYLFLAIGESSRVPTAPGLLVYATGGGSEHPPQLRIKSAPANLTTPGGRGSVVFSRRGDLSGDLVVHYRVGGTNHDALIQPLRGKRVIKAGQSEAKIDLVATGTGSGAVRIVLNEDPAYLIAGKSETVTFLNP